MVVEVEVEGKGYMYRRLGRSPRSDGILPLRLLEERSL